MARKKNTAKGKPLSPAQIRGAEARYLMNTYRRPPVVFTHGRGCRLYDSRGREYLDFLGGIAVNALGHAHPRLVRVIRREAGRAIHLSNLFHNPYQAPLAQKLAEWSGLSRVFFTNSGTEAMDGARTLRGQSGTPNPSPAAVLSARSSPTNNSLLRLRRGCTVRHLAAVHWFVPPPWKFWRSSKRRNCSKMFRSA